MRCGPPVGRTCHTTPWCLPALTDLAEIEREALSPCPVQLSIMEAVFLFISSPVPLAHAAHAHPRPARRWYLPGDGWGARQSAASTSGTVCYPPWG